jgi:putative membrane protein
MTVRSCCMFGTLGLALAALPSIVADARAADAPAAAPVPGGGTATEDTAAVLGKLHHANQMEVEMGKLAQQRGQAQAVKSFGKTLVSDHTAADRKVMAMAKAEKVDLAAHAPAMDEKTENRMDKVKATTGPEFDKAFAKAMLEDHKKDVEDAKAARDRTDDPKLRKLLAATVPVLEKHRDTAQKLVDSLAAPGAATGANTLPPAK